MKMYLMFFFLVVFLGCKKNTIRFKKADFAGFNKIDTFDFSVPLSRKFSRKPYLWKNFFKVRKMLGERYNNITPRSALRNANALQKIADKISDSLLIYEINNAGMHARLNAFKTAVLRLQDMASIPAITVQEVKEQIREIFYLHDAIASKINTHYARKEMDSLLIFEEERIFLERFTDEK